MKLFKTFSISFLLLASTLFSDSIYNYSITSIEGNSILLSVYQGKKIFIITLPTLQNSSNDSLLYSLDSLSNVYSTSLVIIAAPSYEDGFTQGNKSQLQQWYRSKLSPRIIITDGLRSRKTSGAQQHPLFQWLTDKDKNGHFDKDVSGPRSKFLVRANGELFGVLESQTRIGGSTINRLLQTQ